MVSSRNCRLLSGITNAFDGSQSQPYSSIHLTSQLASMRNEKRAGPPTSLSGHSTTFSVSLGGLSFAASRGSLAMFRPMLLRMVGIPYLHERPQG